MAIDWSLEELQLALDEIVTGERLVELHDKNGDSLFVVFRYPSRADMRNSEIKMKQKIQYAIKEKFLTEEQMLAIIYQREIWTAEDDELIEDYKEKIDKWKNKLTNPDLTDKTRQTIIEAVKGFEDKIFEAEYKKEIMLVNTAERKGRQEKYEYLAWSSTYDPETGERLWNNYLTYCRLMDTPLKNNLLGGFVKYLGGRKTEEIRFIARSNLWRINYVIAQKTNTPMFPKSVVELTPDQTNLAWWAGYYDGIYQMMPEDMPDDATIENDEALDAYMEDLHKERSKERQDAKKDKKNPFGIKSARHMKEQLIMRNNPDYMDMEYDNIPGNKAMHQGTDLSLKDEAGAGTKAAKLRTKAIVGSKRFNKEDQT